MYNYDDKVTNNNYLCVPNLILPRPTDQLCVDVCVYTKQNDYWKNIEEQIMKQISHTIAACPHVNNTIYLSTIYTTIMSTCKQHYISINNLHNNLVT